MSSLEDMVGWLADLNAVVVEYKLEADPIVQRQLSAIEIELSGMSLNLPGQQGALKQALLRLHSHRVADQIVEVLQSVLGYYNLPDQRSGTNEPIIGSTTGHHLKAKLLNNEFDVFELQMSIVRLLEGPATGEIE